MVLSPIWGWFYTHDQAHTTPPTVVPGMQPGHIVIINLPWDTPTEDAQCRWTDRWVHVCTTLHEGLQKPPLTTHVLQPAHTTAESHTAASLDRNARICDGNAGIGDEKSRI